MTMPEEDPQDTPGVGVTDRPTDNPIATPNAAELLQSQLSESSPLLTPTGFDYDAYTKHKQRFKKRLWIFGALGLLALLILHLFFLPRTSLSRDFRRYHGMHWTKTDAKRNFLVYSGIGNSTNSADTEEHLNYWLGNFTSLNSQTSLNMLSSDNPDLLKYVQTQFKKYDLAVDSFKFDVPELECPVSLEIALLNGNKEVYFSKLLEPNYDTPAFNGMGVSGEVTAPFLYVNEGTLKDYNLLLSNEFTINGSIVILKSQLDSKTSVAEKVILAETFGAVGVINYFDIPNGDAREFAVPRSSLSSTKPSILSIPANLKSLKPIFATLEKPTFESWDYYPSSDLHSSSGVLKLKMLSKFEPKSDRKLTNVVGRIDGILNEGDIVIGAKRDSFTSTNPLSSHAVMFEVMRHFHTMRKHGWKPLRNIEFVSWDSSSNGLLGSQQLVDHTTILGSKKYGTSSILAYINIDGDAISGSKFKIDSNVILDHALRATSKSVVMPKSHKDYSTLHHYWLKQDNQTINNILGQQIVDSDALVFANHVNVPVVNVKFEHDEKDQSDYVANSNFYSLDWLQKNHIDDKLLLHGTLLRFIGLLTISLSEHDVVDYKVAPLTNLVQSSFELLKSEHTKLLNSWDSKDVSKLITDTKIEKDISGTSFKQLIVQVDKLILESKEAAIIADDYHSHIQNNLIQDYPWYNYYKKLGHYAQFKVANFKLLRSSSQFELDDHDLQFLGIDELYYKNVLYSVPEFEAKTQNDRFKHSTWTNLHEAILREDFDMVVKWLVIIYDKIGYW